MKVIIYSFLLSFFINACVFESTERKPIENLIPEQKMIEILYDIQIKEATINFQRGEDIKVDDLKASYYQNIFDKYEIDLEVFKENLQYYTQKPEDLKRMYQVIYKRIEAKKDSLNTTKEQLKEEKEELELSEEEI